MPSKCGHAGATCIVGNYWECKECDNARKVTAVDKQAGTITISVMPDDGWRNDSEIAMEVYRELPKAVPQTISTWKADVTAQTTAQVTEFLKSIGTPWVDKLQGIATVVDGQTCYTLSHYGAIQITPQTNLNNVKAHVRSVLEYMLSGIEKTCELVATSRGWKGEHHTATLGQFIHAVSDDGQILRYAHENVKELEMRFRSFYHPMPGKLCH